MTDVNMDESPELTPEQEKLLDEYGVLARNLKQYFPSVEDPEDKSEDFIKEFHLVGEKSKNFDGLLDQIDRAIKRPGEFSQVLQLVLGVKFNRDQTSEYMLDLYNRLTDRDEQKIRAEKDVDERFNYYFNRPIKLPFTVPKLNRNVVPLWSIGAVSLLVAAIGLLGFNFLQGVPVVWQIFLAFLIVGTTGFTLVVITMFFLRDETINADKYAERDENLKQWREAKRKKKGSSRWRLPSFRE